MKRYKPIFTAMKSVNGLSARYKKDQSDENYTLLQAALTELQEELGKVLK